MERKLGPETRRDLIPVPRENQIQIPNPYCQMWPLAPLLEAVILCDVVPIG